MTLLAALVLAVGSLAVGPRPALAVTDSLDLRATYDVSASIQWSAGAMTVSSVAHVTNTRAENVDHLTFNVLPLRLGRLQLIGASVDGLAAQVVASDQSLVVALPTALAPTAEANVRIDYKAFFNTNTRGKKALFMHKSGIAASYRWIPWLSREQQFKTPNFGESWVTGVSSRVNVTFSSDVPLVYATSGVQTSSDGLTQTFSAADVRDFNFSASPGYSVRQELWNGITVSIYYRKYTPDRLWNSTRRAMERFSAAVGPYPYTHLSVAETPAGVGMESPAMIWIDATLEKSRFPYIVAHETAHQWFYSTVGNNQAADPFVDEAVADFLTRDLLGSFRKSTCPEARLDGTVYDYSARCYPEVVYVQGGLYLKAYSEAVGSEIFWAGIQQFYRDNQFGIAGSRSLLNHLDAVSGFDSQRHAERFPTLYE